MAAIESGRAIVAVLVVGCVVIEGYLQLADLGVVGSARLRQTAYEYGGFWPGLLGNWRPNYPGQSVAMFVTYGFLHGGIVHLVFNMLTLWSLSVPVVDRVGGLGFLAVYVVTILGGAVGYFLLNVGFQPMVGASGALFGLAGALIAWSYIDRFAMALRLWPTALAILSLIAMNAVLWWAMDGRLAWETHLGGFITGWFIATVIDPRPKSE